MSTAAPLEADGRHLMTDVWTSVGVVAGVLLVAVTGWEPLDPIIALLVAVNIVVTGVSLVRRFTGALLDRAHVSVHVLVPGTGPSNVATGKPDQSAPTSASDL